MRKIYIVVGALLVFVGIFFMTAIDIVAGAIALAAATQGIGRMRVVGKVLGTILGLVAIVGLVRPDFFGLMQATPRDAVVHLVAALTFLYVGLLAPPRL